VTRARAAAAGLGGGAGGNVGSLDILWRVLNVRERVGDCGSARASVSDSECSRRAG